MEKLSSGYKINRAGDDAAGLAISEKMRCTITGLTQGTENADHGTGLVRTAEAAMDEIHAMLNRVVELSVQSANGTYDDEIDRNALQKEVDQIVTEVDRIVESTNYNGIPLLTRDTVQANWTEIVKETAYKYQDYEYYSDKIIDKVTEVLGTPLTPYTSSYQVSQVSNNQAFSSNGVRDNYTYYTSTSVTVPSQTLSVPASAEFPYEIQMIVSVYDDKNSTDDNSLVWNGTEAEYVASGSSNIKHQVITVRVEQVGSGYTVQGKSETVDSANLSSYNADSSGTAWKEYYDVAFRQTGKDAQNAADPSKKDTTLYYVEEKTATSTHVITTDEMQLVMEDLLNGLPYGVYAGGGSTSHSSTTIYLDSDNYKIFNDAGYYYNRTTGRWTYPPGVTSPETFINNNFTSEERGYGVGSGTTGLGYTYQNNFRFYGSSSSTNGNVQTGRVLGVEFLVETGTGSSPLVDTSWPSGFDAYRWNSNSDMSDLAGQGVPVLGVGSVQEPYHSTVNVNFDNVLTGADIAGMTESQFQNYLKNYLLHISQTTTESNKPSEVVTKEASYALVRGPVDPAVEQKLLDAGAEYVVWADPDPALDYVAVNELCLAIVNSPTLHIITANRELDSTSHTSLDDNVTKKYNIELGTFTKTVKNFKDTVEQVEEGMVTGTKAESYLVDKEIHVSGLRPDPIILQVGDQNQDFDRVFVYIQNMRGDVEDLANVDVSKQDSAAQGISVVKELINRVSGYRGDMGAYDNRLQHTINRNRITTENLQQAESLIRDADMAEEMMKFTKNNILIQSSQSMLAQANTLPQGVLELLG